MILTKLKNNIFYKFYFKLKHVKDRQTKNDFNNEVRFYSELIQGEDLIFDIGANHGDKSAIFLKIAKKVVAFEPDHSNCEFLNYRFYGNSKFILVPKAISEKVGSTTFFLVNNGSGLNTIDIDQKDKLSISNSYIVETTTLGLMIEKFGIPDFIKIDVEGHELSVLKGLSISIKDISFEANLPNKLNDTLEIIKLIIKLNNKYKFNYGFDYGLNSNCWLNEQEIIEFLNSTNEPYLNIYCKIIL